MKLNGMTALEFEKKFATEKQCIEHLRKVRWPGGFICPGCGHDDGYILKDIRITQCAVCRKQTSVMVSTIFESSHMALTIWFRVIYAMAEDKGGASAARLSRQLGVPHKTIWGMMFKIRSAMASRNDAVRLGGEIELDEVYINKEARKYQETPKTETTVLVMVENEGERAGEIIMYITPASTSANTRSIAEHFTVDDSKCHFRTDGWHAHHVLKKMGHDLDIQPMAGKLSVEKLPWVHTFASLVRRYLMGTYHGVSPKLLQDYLDELCFRVNRRFRTSTICFSLLKACVYAPPRILAVSR